MRNLKKTLVALLVVSMVIAGFTGVAGATFSDTAGHKAANKIEKLAALGVLAGYPDGTFKPDNNITRAEFAKIACILAGLKSSGDILKNSPSKFSDVAAGEWYTGWVNLAVSQGYMKGYPDGTFKPNANVTNAEVLTVLCRLIGYNDNLPGDWPVEYLVKAADLDISDGLTFDSSAPATRGNVCWFAEQSLEVEKVSWSKDDEKFVKETENGEYVTILSESFEGGIKEDYLCYDWRLDGSKLKISVYAGDGNGGFDPSDADSKDWVVAKDVVLNGASHASGLANKIIDFVVNDDNEVIYAEVKNYGSLSDTEGIKESDTRFEINDKTYSVNTNGYAKIGTGSRQLFSSYDADTTWNTDDGYQKINALLNEDGEVAYVYTSWDAKSDGTPLRPGVVKSVASNKKISFKDGASGTMGPQRDAFNADVTDSDTEYIVFRDGKVASITDIQPDDLLWIYDGTNGSTNGYDYRLVARSTKAKGKLEEFASDFDENVNTYTIAGKDYDSWMTIKLSDDGGDAFDVTVNDSDDLEDVVGETVAALIDGNGYVRYIISDVSAVENAMYGVVSEVFGSTSSTGWRTTSIEIFTKDGELHTYAVDSDSDDLAKAKQGTGDLDNDGTDEEFMYFESGDQAGYKDTKDYLVFRGLGSDGTTRIHGKPLVKFTLQDDGAIDSFEVITKGEAGAPGTYSADTADDDPVTITIDTAGTYGFAQAVIFDVHDDDSDNWEVLDPNDVVDWIQKNNTLDMVGFVVDDGEVTYVAGISSGVTSAADYAMVMGKGYDADGPYIKVLGSDGKAVKKPGEDTIDGNATDWKKLGEGSVIEYTLSGGVIQSWWFSEADDPDEKDGVGVKVYDVKSSGTKRIAIGGPSTYYYVDDDTLFWNIAGDDPINITIHDVQEEDTVDFLAKDGILKWIVVK